MKLPPAFFKHCPSCASREIAVDRSKLTCRTCGFNYFFNPTIGTAGFIIGPDASVLLIRRGKEPGKGKLAPPGGFADYGESAEEALSREVKEETGLHITQWSYLLSAVNWYPYQDITYPVIDFFFTGRVTDRYELHPCRNETEGARWHSLHAVDPGDLAFPSMQAAFRAVLRGHAGPHPPA